MWGFLYWSDISVGVGVPLMRQPEVDDEVRVCTGGRGRGGRRGTPEIDGRQWYILGPRTGGIKLGLPQESYNWHWYHMLF